MAFRSVTLICASLAIHGLAATVPRQTSSGLNAAAQSIGKVYFGSATDNPELNNTEYVSILSQSSMFGQITPTNSMKWDATEPEQGNFTFDEAEQIVNLALSNGQIMRGHNCVWHEQLPDWVANGTFTADELTSILQNHCGTLVGHFKGQIFSWDVVNEPFNDNGTFGEDVFLDVLGTDYIPIALKAARAADPNAKLYINEFNIEFAGPKATAMLNLVKQLQADGVPIDGIGFQSHFIVGQVPTDFAAVMSNFTALGLEVAITELDIRMTLPETDALLAQQQTDYQNVVSACKSVAGCVGITLWDYTDLFSWIPGTFAGMGAACPWDENLNEKPAFNGIMSGLLD